jgi:hypothetical protein
MTLNEFKGLNEEQQAHKVWDGVFLDLRTNANQSILLFDLGGFYVEVYYEHNQNQIVRLTPFRSTNPLMPYLNLMNIKELESLL